LDAGLESSLGELTCAGRSQLDILRSLALRARLPGEAAARPGEPRGEEAAERDVAAPSLGEPEEASTPDAPGDIGVLTNESGAARPASSLECPAPPPAAQGAAEEETEAPPNVSEPPRSNTRRKESGVATEEPEMPPPASSSEIASPTCSARKERMTEGVKE
jgi:hypothetical protein